MMLQGGLFCQFCIPGDPGFVLFANRHNIRRILLDASEYTSVYSAAEDSKASIIALDFHVRSGTIFWTDVTREKIYRAKLNGSFTVQSTTKAIVTQGLQTPDGIAVDWINEKLYWTDAGIGVIEVADFDGSNRLVLVREHLDEPRAIVLMPALG